MAVHYYCETETQTVSLSAEHDAAEWVSPAVARDRLDGPQGTAVDRAVAEHLKRIDDPQVDTDTFAGPTHGTSESGASQ